jgi:MFS family permease
VQTFLVHTVTAVLRPTTSYRALEVGVPPAALGALSASFAVLPLFLALAAGRFTDRGGERRTLLLGAVLVVAGAVAFATTARTLTALLACSALLGLGHLLSMIGQQSLVASLNDAGRYDAAFGHYTLAAAVGQTAGPALVAALGGTATIPDTDRIFVGALAVSLAVLACTAALPATPPHPGTGDGPPGGIRDALAVPSLWRPLLASMVVIAAVDLLVVYLPALGAERGIASGVVGLLLSVRAASSMVSRLLLAAAARRLGRRRLLAGSIWASAVAVALLPVPMPLAALLVVVSLVGLALGIGQPLTMSWVAQSVPLHVRATALALRISGNRLGQVAVPAGVGVLAADAGAGGVLWGTAGALAVTAALSGGGADRPPAQPRR